MVDDLPQYSAALFL